MGQGGGGRVLVSHVHGIRQENERRAYFWGKAAHLLGALEEVLVGYQRLLLPISSRTTLLVELSCKDSPGLSYQPGEHLGVFPSNQPALVQGILERVVDGPAPHQPVCLETLSETGESSTQTLC